MTDDSAQRRMIFAIQRGAADGLAEHFPLDPQATASRHFPGGAGRTLTALGEGLTPP